MGDLLDAELHAVSARWSSSLQVGLLQQELALANGVRAHAFQCGHLLLLGEEALAALRHPLDAWLARRLVRFELLLLQ